MSKSNFRSMKVTPKDVDIFAACLAQIAYQMDENLDEVECFEIACQQLRKGDMTFIDAVEMGIMFKTTKFQEARNKWS